MYVDANAEPPDLLDDDGNASMATAIMMSHHAFRRDLASFAAALADLDVSRVDALREEWRSFHEHLHGHHVAEDTGIFPGMREAMADLIEHLMADHQRIGPLLTRGDQAFAALPDTSEARVVIAELQDLLRPHLGTEEADVFQHLRGLREFPVPSEEELPVFAEGFAWASHGVASDVVMRMDAMLPEVLRAALPTAREAYAARCVRAWGTARAGATRTPFPN
jgi:hypothetical protein